LPGSAWLDHPVFVVSIAGGRLRSFFGDADFSWERIAPRLRVW